MSDSSPVGDAGRARRARIDLLLKELDQHTNSLVELALAIQQVDGAIAELPRARVDKSARIAASKSGPDADMVG